MQEAIADHIEEIRRVELGVWSGDLDKLKERLTQLRREREEQHRQYLETFNMLANLTASHPKPIRWPIPMSMDEYLDSRGQIRTQEYVEGHHRTQIPSPARL